MEMLHFCSFKYITEPGSEYRREYNIIYSAENKKSREFSKRTINYQDLRINSTATNPTITIKKRIKRLRIIWPILVQTVHSSYIQITI